MSIAQLVGHTGTIAALDVAPESKTVVSASFDTTLRIWRLTVPGDRETALLSPNP
jgi:WD40 repeat protein